MLVALTGCSGSATSPGTQSAPTQPPVTQPVTKYAALGDSFTAAPFVPVTDLANGCLRSSNNYPAMVAEELDARLQDVSCSGAESADITSPQEVAGGRGTVPPQIRAVEQDTDVVTVSIGGNDNALFATLINRCTAVADQPGSPCADQLTSELGASGPLIAQVERRVKRVLERLSSEAPDATVVLVGYSRLVAADRGCQEFPLAPGDRPWLVDVEEQLNAALHRAARSTGAEFVDMHEVSRGHEICSDDPWVNGSVTDQSRAASFHPFEEGQQAVAEQVLAVVS